MVKDKYMKSWDLLRIPDERNSCFMQCGMDNTKGQIWRRDLPIEKMSLNWIRYKVDLMDGVALETEDDGKSQKPEKILTL